MAQLNDLIVNGYTRFLNSAYGNLNGSATSALCAANASTAVKAADSDKLGGTAAANFALKTGAYTATTQLSAYSAVVAGSAPVGSHTISSHSDSANFFTGNSAKSACSATSAKNAGTADNALKVYHSAWNANSARAVVFTETASGYSQIGTAADFTYNPSTKLLSVVSASATNVRGVTVSATSSIASSGKISTGNIATAYGASAKYDNISSTNLTGVTTSGTTIKGVTVSATSAIATSGKINTGNILTAYGSSAKFDTISGTNITAATTVKATNLSGTNISGATSTMTIDNLIKSATRSISNNYVTQARTTANDNYPVIFKYNNSTADVTNAVKFNEDLVFNPSSNTLKLNNGTLSCEYNDTNSAQIILEQLTGTTKNCLSANANTIIASGSNPRGTWGPYSAYWSSIIRQDVRIESADDNFGYVVPFATSSSPTTLKYDQLFLFDPANNALYVGAQADISRGGVITNYITAYQQIQTNNIYCGGSISGAYIIGDEGYFGDNVYVGGAWGGQSTLTGKYIPKITLNFGSATDQDSTYSSNVPMILFRGGNSNTSYNCSAALAFSYYNTPKRFGTTLNRSLLGGWFDFTVNDDGSKNAGVLADCFSATSGYFSNNYVNDVHVLSSIHISANELWVPDYFYMYASPNTEDGRFILSGKLSAESVSAGIINTPTANINSGSFMWTSATTAKAELFSGTTGKFTNISGTNITAANQLTAATGYVKTLSGVSSKQTYISSTYITAGELTRLFSCGGIADHWTSPSQTEQGPMNQFLNKTSNIVYIMPTGAQGTNVNLPVNVTSLNINDGDHNGVFEVHYYSPYAYPNGNDPLRITVGNFPAGVATSAYIYYDKGNVTATSSQRFYSSTYVKTNGTTGFDLYLGFSGAQGVPSTSVVSRNHIAQFYYSSGQHRLFIHCYG